MKYKTYLNGKKVKVAHQSVSRNEYCKFNEIARHDCNDIQIYEEVETDFWGRETGNSKKWVNLEGSYHIKRFLKPNALTKAVAYTKMLDTIEGIYGWLLVHYTEEDIYSLYIYCPYTVDLPDCDVDFDEISQKYVNGQNYFCIDDFSMLPEEYYDVAKFSGFLRGKIKDEYRNKVHNLTVDQEMFAHAFFKNKTCSYLTNEDYEKLVNDLKEMRPPLVFADSTEKNHFFNYHGEICFAKDLSWYEFITKKFFRNMVQLWMLKEEDVK